LSDEQAQTLRDELVGEGAGSRGCLDVHLGNAGERHRSCSISFRRRFFAPAPLLGRAPDSLHTEGFFKRESSLFRQLVTD